MTLDEVLKKYKLSHSEYELATELIGHEPNPVELALLSAMWSEHCSYKSSKTHLKKFATKSDKVLEGMGENAGVVDLGEGERIAFKMESHNHPSYIEPFQGAATGVGGILRDIFTMGARPIALANYLCFGQMKAYRMKHLVDQVVKGISFYGNCVGVPNVTGQTEFHKSYNKNILVNAFALGYFGREDRVFTARSAQVGDYIVYVGAKTGVDGINGASMASESFEDGNKTSKTTIQKGDPFYEKLLIESCLEVMKKDLVSSIQDMGAAGLTSSTFEMSARCGYGFRVHLDKVPLRNAGMSPEDILLSESQERMLMACSPKVFAQVKEVFNKWNLDAEVIGEVLNKKQVELLWHEEILTEIDPRVLVDNAPVYDRPYQQKVIAKNTLTEKYDYRLFKYHFEKLLSSAENSSRSHIYSQYDQRVGAKTISACEEPVGVIKLPESKRDLAIVMGCRPHLMRVHPEVGAFDAFFEPYLQLCIKGFEPLAMTDCLNFGNPEKSNIMGQLVNSVEALATLSKKYDVPVISGNVSLYNETAEGNITPTPSVGMIGLKNEKKIIKSYFSKEGSFVYILRCPQFKSTSYFSEQFDMHNSFVDLREGKEFLDVKDKIVKLINQPQVLNTRLVGKLGPLYSLFRMCSEDIGVKVGASFVESLEHPFMENSYEILLETTEELNLPEEDIVFEKVGVTVAKTFEVSGVASWKTKFLLDLYNKSQLRRVF